ncbi:MAG: argininosuccinate lyase [Bacteroides sp. SM23_62_1]|nr:MAG: argininosuccinate lyase [Bacteroides sp. SM23_62_1]
MKIWDKGTPLDKIIEDFTSGKDRELDHMLAEYDVIASIAHTVMLESAGFLSNAESKAIIKELKKIHKEILKKDFTIPEGVEDIHSELENRLIAMLGEQGKKIHSGRSRNDQVLTDIQLFIRDRISEIVTQIEILTGELLQLSERYRDYFLPGYTHFQAAMPSSFGLWFGSFAESLADDLLVILAAYRITNQNPLGSGAGFGTSFPINRNQTTQLLGFDSLRYNSMHAMNSRGKNELVTAQALASLATTIGRYAGDICMYAGGNFDFISLPEKFTTGSSIMPHKKNPDVFELIRATCSMLQALPNEISMITNNLPSGYHRDYQILKEHFLPAFDKVIKCLQVMIYMMPEIIIKKIDRTDEKYKYIFSVEYVNKLVMDGIPFRDAYRKVADEIKKGQYTLADHPNYSHEGSIGNLCNDRISEKIRYRIQMFEFEKAQQAIRNLLEMS